MENCRFAKYHLAPSMKMSDLMNVDEKLGELERMVMREVPRSCDRQDIYRALQNIFAFKEDIRMHTAVEKNRNQDHCRSDFVCPSE